MRYEKNKWGSSLDNLRLKIFGGKPIDSASSFTLHALLKGENLNAIEASVEYWHKDRVRRSDRIVLAALSGTQCNGMEYHSIKRLVKCMQMTTSMSHLLVNQLECQPLVRWPDNRLIIRLLYQRISQSIGWTCSPLIKSYLMHYALRHRFFVKNSHTVKTAGKTDVLRSNMPY